MRAYPTNSPKAVSRLLALTMIVDGHLAPSELKAMRASGIPVLFKPVNPAMLLRALAELAPGPLAH